LTTGQKNGRTKPALQERIEDEQARTWAKADVIVGQEERKYTAEHRDYHEAGIDARTS
jgi:hypothetical protein